MMARRASTERPSRAKPGTLIVLAYLLAQTLCPTNSAALEIRKREKILAYTVKIDSIDRKVLAQGSGGTATVHFTIAPTKYHPKSITLFADSSSWDVTEISQGGSYTADLIEGTDLNALKKYTIKIVVDKHTSNLDYVTVIGIETETQATVPSDRTRKKLGIGENVSLTLTPAGLSPIAWSKTGDGSLSATSGGTVIFTAYDRATTPSVTATYDGVPCSMAFTVVEPTSESAIKSSEDSFPAGTQGAGMRLEITISPTDVSFENVESQEVAGPASNITGYFTTVPAVDLAHTPTGWVQIAVGNKKYDHAAFSGILPSGSPPSWSTGGFQWVIPIEWRVVGSAHLGTLPNRMQTFAITNAAGTSTVSKLGQSVTRTP